MRMGCGAARLSAVSLYGALLCAVALLSSAEVAAQQSRSGPNARFPGSAVVTVGEDEYTIRIECRVQGQPEAGFTTEPNRVTREETGGKYNMVTLRLRPWQDTQDVIVSLQNFVAWMPAPASAGGTLSLELDMSPASVMRNNAPVAITYDRWQSGDRPPGQSGVKFEANCSQRDPEAPSFRKLPG